MNDPLGTAVGNALEVMEAIDALNGKGDAKLMEVVYTLASYMVFGAGKASTVEEARNLLEETITSGKALDTFAKFVKAQGGDDRYVYDPSLFELGSIKEDLLSDTEGYITNILADEVGIASLLLGGGREKKDDVIDPGVGIIIHKKTSDRVTKGEPIATLFANNADKLKEAKRRLRGAFTIGSEKKEAYRTVYDIIE